MNRYILSKSILLAPDDDAGGGGGVSQSDESKAFHSKFSANRPGLELPIGTPGAKEVSIEEKVVEEKQEAEEKVIEEKPPLIQPKKPGSNVPKIIEEKRKAEQERDELRARAEKFEKEEKPTLEKKIADLEAKMSEGGHSTEEREKLQARLDAAETKLADREKSLVNENDQLRTRLAFHDIQQDPIFKKKYVQPMVDAYGSAAESFQNDEQKLNLFRRGLMANSAALSSNKPEERAAAEKERNQYFSQILDSLSEFERGQFTTGVNEYIRATKHHAKALADHEETRKETMREAETNRIKETGKIFETWTTANSQLAKNFDPDTAIEPELEEAIKELGLDFGNDLKKSSSTVERVITGRAEINESIEMLQRGRVYPAMKAKVAAQAHIIKGLQETIKKMRSSRPSGGKETVVETEKVDINHKFRASRPGVMGRKQD